MASIDHSRPTSPGRFGLELETRVMMARLAILDVLFDGDPLSWRSWLIRHGSAAQKAEDLPFVERLCRERRASTGIPHPPADPEILCGEFDP